MSVLLVAVSDADGAIERELAAGGFPCARLDKLADLGATLRQSAAELVVLDYDMPDGQGPAVLATLEHEIKQSPEGTLVPAVVVLAGEVSPRGIVRLFRSGADDVVLKPVTAAELVLALRGLRARLVAKRRLPAPPKAAETAEAPAEAPPTPSAPRVPHGLKRPAWATPQIAGASLPPIHPLLAQIQNASSDLTGGVKNVLTIAEADQALASRVLQLANSGAHRGTRTYTNIRDACVRLGNREVVNIFLEAALAESFKTAHPALTRIIEHCRRSAVLGARASRHISRLLNLGKIEEIYAAGLLHNVGELLMLWRFGQSLPPGKPLGGEAFDEAAYWIDQGHEEVGAAFAKDRGMPLLVVMSAANHHSARPRESDVERLLRRVVLAGWALAREAVGPYLPTSFPSESSALLTALSLPPHARDELWTQLRQWIDEKV